MVNHTVQFNTKYLNKVQVQSNDVCMYLCRVSAFYRPRGLGIRELF